jgi:hypothetical protein
MKSFLLKLRKTFTIKTIFLRSLFNLIIISYIPLYTYIFICHQYIIIFVLCSTYKCSWLKIIGNFKGIFIDFVAFQKTAENAAQWTFKGQRVIVQGKLIKRSYDGNEGKKVWITEVHADRLEYTDFKEKEAVEKPAGKPVFDPNAYENPFVNAKPVSLSDSDLPF